jgi:peptidoglycan/LPS O-acetylase OafA/YrhL
MAAFHLLNTSPNGRAFFRINLMQYLGRISYGLYLVHSFVLHTVGYAMFNFVWGIIGVETTFAKEIGFFIATAAIIPYAIYAADVFHRAVDEPSVDLAKWIESKVIVAG